VFGVIDRRPQIDSSSEQGLRPPQGLQGEVLLESVDFIYPARPDVQVFKGLTLRIPAGRSLALVGESGSGKVGLFVAVFFSFPQAFNLSLLYLHVERDHADTSDSLSHINIMYSPR
jgi:ABC-type multidrug transport system fused ATPase/permease subunit